MGFLSVVLLSTSVSLDVWFMIALATSAGSVDPFVNIWLAAATQWVPVVLFWVVAARTHFRRTEVVFAAAAVTFSAMGDTHYSLAMGSNGYLPSPSLADIGYLLFYPLMLGSLIVFARRQGARVGRAVALDAAVASLGAAAFIAAVLSPVLRDALAGTDVAAALVNVAYPLLDLVLVAAVVGIAASPTIDAGQRWTSLVAGLFVLTGADIAYALLDHAGAYVSGTPLDAAWAVGLTLIAWWIHGLGTTPAVDNLKQRPHGGRVALPVTSFGFVAALGVLLFGTQVPISGLALVLATATAGLAAVPVMFRQAMLSQLLADQQRILKETERLDRSKSEMLTTMNHELRTPLTSILGYLEIVRDGGGGQIPAAADEMLDIAENNAIRMRKLIDEMLVLTRLDAQTSSEFSNIALADVLAGVESTVARFAVSRGVGAKFNQSDATLSVAGNQPDLQRALTNLVENAIKFTPRGGSVIVTSEAADVDGSATLTTISDTGMGIPPEEISRLSTRFFRASNAQLQSVPGVGLGMSIAQEIVRAHQGTITVISTLGEGTTISVRLPRTQHSSTEK
ncbi:MAG TPA: HAMP domain-containing sensor histidine kinase [Glaciihabitans sp.]|nr:HAMP domain-containing sensor histidine kinase [Glaciihabitans sp.]